MGLRVRAGPDKFDAAEAGAIKDHCAYPNTSRFQARAKTVQTPSNRELELPWPYARRRL